MSDEIVLPQNAEAEAAVLGLLLLRGEQFTQISAHLSADDFATEKHRRIWHAISALYSAGGFIDNVTVAHHLIDSGHLESCGGVSYLSAIADYMLSASGADAYCRMVKDASIRRRAIIAAQKLTDELILGSDMDALAQAERFLRDLSSERQRDRKLRTAGQIVADEGGVDRFLAASRATVSTPWPGLNVILGGGFRPDELVIVAARTSVGKTAAGLQIADHAGSHGIGTAVYSLEMGCRQLLHRMACSRARVDGNALRHGRLSYEQRMALGRAMAEISAMPVYFDDTSSCTVPAIHASLRRLMASQPIGLVVVDYLQLVDSIGRHENRTQAVGAVSRGLKLAAREFGIPFVVSAQLSRAAEDRTEPQLRDLRESGSIESDADIVLFLHRTGDKFGDVIPAKFLVAKQRNGPLGPVALNFRSRWARFEETTEAEENAA